jgi:ABC-type oligopeptide transport system substrate-binding subunit
MADSQTRNCDMADSQTWNCDMADSLTWLRTVWQCLVRIPDG